MLSWWYTTGWRQRFSLLQAHLGRTTDYFSIGLLSRTLFAPFRQIAAGKTKGSLSVQFQALLDQLFSRLIGACVRTLMIILGLIAIVVLVIVGGVTVVLWAVIPLLPVVGVILAVIGWMPWR
jgi:hypothetical protein